LRIESHRLDSQIAISSPYRQLFVLLWVTFSPFPTTLPLRLTHHVYLYHTFSFNIISFNIISTSISFAIYAINPQPHSVLHPIAHIIFCTHHVSSDVLPCLLACASHATLRNHATRCINETLPTRSREHRAWCRLCPPWWCSCRRTKSLVLARKHSKRACILLSLFLFIHWARQIDTCNDEPSLSRLSAKHRA